MALIWRDELKDVLRAFQAREEVSAWTMGGEDSAASAKSESEMTRVMDSYLTLHSFIAQAVERGETTW